MFVYKHRVTTCFYYHDNTVRVGAGLPHSAPPQLTSICHTPPSASRLGTARVCGLVGLINGNFCILQIVNNLIKKPKTVILCERTCVRACVVCMRMCGSTGLTLCNFLSFKLIKKPKTCVQTEHINVGARFFTMKQTLCVETEWCGRSVKTLLLCRSSWCDLCL